MIIIRNVTLKFLTATRTIKNIQLHNERVVRIYMHYKMIWLNAKKKKKKQTAQAQPAQRCKQ